MITAREIRHGLGPVRDRVIVQPGVLFVGIGEIAEDDDYCVVVGIDDQMPGNAGDLPGHVAINGKRICLKTERVSPEALNVADGKLDGSDLLVASRVGRVGTLGLILQDGRTGKLFGLTNAHVVTRPNENHVGDPVEAVLEGVRQEIGHVAYHATYNSAALNTVDLALIELNANGVTQARAFAVQTFAGTVVGSGSLSFSRFAGSRRPHAYGGSTQAARHVVTCERPVEHPLFDLRDGNGHALRFGRAFTLTAGGPGVRPGHSGSLIVRQKANDVLIAVGLLAGGQGRTAVAFSMSDVLQEMARAGVVPT